MHKYVKQLLFQWADKSFKLKLVSILERCKIEIEVQEFVFSFTIISELFHFQDVFKSLGEIH